MQDVRNSAILLMGGSGSRFGTELPKQFHRLSGKKIYLHTLDKFLEFSEIILVCHEKYVAEVQEDIKNYPSHIKVIAGGDTRQASSYLGLLACQKGTEYVVIHDAVRPFVSKRIIQQNFEGAILHQAVDTCIPSSDTIVHSKTGTVIDEIPNRSEYLRGQTPQSFHYPLILRAHQTTTMTNSSDDCSLVSHPIHIVQGDEHNIKITTGLDLFIAEQLFRLSHTHLTESKSSIRGKKIIITGGTGGIGKAIVSLLEQEGATPIVVSRNTLLSADLTSYAAAVSIFQQIGVVDGLINCVGQFKLKEIEDLTPLEIEEQISVNLTSLIYACKCVKLTDDGHIINISSSSYSKGRKEYPIYSAAKAAVVNFTQGLADTYKNKKINVLVPHRTNTPLRREHFPSEPVASLLTPEEIALAAVNLLKQNITGSIISV